MSDARLERLLQRLPEIVRRRAELQGDAGVSWIEALPDITGRVLARWDVVPTEVLSGGSEALVILGRRDGKDVVVKIGPPPDCDCVREARILTLAKGRGFVELYDVDEADNALLLEKLGARLSESGLSDAERLSLLVGAMRRTWISLEDHADLMTGGAKAEWLAEFIESTSKALGEPCKRNGITTALDFCQERAAAYQAEGSFLVHGDAHDDNALFAADGSVKLIDPDGLYAEPACDLATIMRDWSRSLLSGDPLVLGIERSETLASLAGVSELSVWQWGMMERVSTGLLLLKLGSENEGRDMLAVAEAWAGR